MNLSGEWIGHYQRHYEQVVKIEQSGSYIRAIKITGDEFIPAGELTWEVDLSTQIARGHVSELEYRKPRTVPGKLTVLSEDRIVFRFDFGDRQEDVEYRRDE